MSFKKVKVNNARFALIKSRPDKELYEVIYNLSRNMIDEHSWKNYSYGTGIKTANIFFRYLVREQIEISRGLK